MRHLARVHPDSAHGRAREDELTRFCTHCASLFDAPTNAPDRPLRGRVCESCGLGVVLTCASGTLSAPGAAFLVVTADLRISAASDAAEHLLGVPDGAYGRPLLSLVVSSDGIGELARLVASAASGTLAPVTIPIEASGSRLPNVPLQARVGGCGDPPAALVVLEPAS